MKPELLLLIKLSADQYALTHSIHELMTSLYLKQMKPELPLEKHPQFQEVLLQRSQTNSTAMLRACLEFLDQYYPSTFVSETGKKESVEELLRKISLLNQDSENN